MDANKVSFNELITQSGIQFVVPIWQRLYSWDRKEWKDLWNDLMDLYEKIYEDNAPAEHFLGATVVKPLEWKVGKMQRLTLVDGQQRFATLLLLCALLRNRARDYEQNKDLVAEIEDDFLFNKHHKKAYDKPKLRLTHADHRIFDQIINGVSIEKLISGSRLRLACSFFAKVLEENKGKYDIGKLMDIIRRLRIVIIKLEPTDNPNRIFETLNYRGKGLEQSDLVRNYFMMAIKDEARADQIYKNIWFPMQQSLGSNTTECIRNLETFLRHYVVMTKHEFVKKNRVYVGIQKKIKYSSEDYVISELRTIRKYSQYYERLLYPSREENPKIRKAIERLKRLGVGVYYPFLLKVYHAFESKDSKVSENDFFDILRTIESYLVRRFFLQRPTNSLNRLFATLCEVPEDNIVAYFQEKIAAKRPWSAQYWPRDKEFAESFQAFPIYVESPRRCRFILEVLEESYCHPEKLMLEELTIEHVMPRTLGESWQKYLKEEDWEKLKDREERTRYLHSIGNLTLIAMDPNRDLSNKLFPEKKKDWYAYSNVELTKEICRRWDKWSLAEIGDRAKILAVKALSIWPGPE